MNTTRRRFIQAGLGGSALISLSSSVPQVLLGASTKTNLNQGEKILVVVELSGGNDGLNTVIPFADDEYYKNRFTLAVAKEQVLKLDDHVGFHPVMQGFSKLVEQGRLAVVQGVGYPNPNRSHFESMDLWHTAHQVGQRQTGWVGKCVEENELADQLPAIHFGTSAQPLAMKSLKRPSPSIRTLDDFQLFAGRDERLAQLLKPMMQSPRANSNPLLTFVHDNAKIALDTSDRLEKISKSPTGDAVYPGTRLGQDLQSVARLINSGLPTRIYYVTLGGFDTHSNQAEAHSGLLRQLSDAVSAFVLDMQQQGNGDRVAVMSFSEFGRRVRENASRGTDHGTAAPMFLAGGGIKPGVVGEHPSLDDLEEGDLKYRIDYRRVYNEVLEQWLGIEPNEILNGEFKPVGLFS